MSKDDLHAHASQDLPEHIELPKTWPALFVWAAGKWGVGVVGFALLIPVYLDLKASNDRFAKLAEANVSAINTLANSIQKGHESVGEMKETVRRLETYMSTKRE